MSKAKAAKQAAREPEADDGPRGWTALRTGSGKGWEKFAVAIDIRDLYPLVRIHRVTDGRGGYQRPLDEKKADAIAAYVDAGGCIPGSLSFAADEDSGIAYIPGGKAITRAHKPGSLLSIDGQHRLEGYHRAKNYGLVECSIVVGLSPAAQARVFRDVNHLATPVSRALLLETARLADAETAHEARCRVLFDALAKVPPLAGNLDPFGLARGKLGRPQFNGAVSAIWRGKVGSALGDDADKRAEFVARYLCAWADELPAKHAPIAKATVLGAVMDVVDATTEAATALHKGATPKALRAVARLAVEGAADELTRRYTRRSLADALRAALPGAIDLGGG